MSQSENITDENLCSVKKYVNLINDPPIVVNVPNQEMIQNFALLSFVSPEDMVQKRMIHDLAKFLEHDINSNILATTQHILQLIKDEIKASSKDLDSSKDLSSISKIIDSINDEKIYEKVYRKYSNDEDELFGKFTMYQINNEKELENSFNSQHDNKTHIRGIKFRGAYETLAEAQNRAKYLSEEIEKNVNIFIAPTGKWCPFDPEPDGVKDQHYQLQELDDLMHKYNENMEHKTQVFHERVKSLTEKTIESDKKLKDAKKNINQLQSILK